MHTNINILDKDYLAWVNDLIHRYKASQIKAAVRVNREVLQFYWSVGRDIVTLQAESRWGDKVIQSLSRDLKKQMPEATCFSPTNLLYMKNFYVLFNNCSSITPQPVEQITTGWENLTPQVVEQLGVDI